MAPWIQTEKGDLVNLGQVAHIGTHSNEDGCYLFATLPGGVFDGDRVAAPVVILVDRLTEEEAATALDGLGVNISRFQSLIRTTVVLDSCGIGEERISLTDAGLDAIRVQATEDAQGDTE